MDKKFLDNGSPVATQVAILKANTLIKITNPEKMSGAALPLGTLGRIHSLDNKTGRYQVWLLDEINMNSIIIEVPLNLMGQYFVRKEHGIFPHLA
jgi:hypothetical protein